MKGDLFYTGEKSNYSHCHTILYHNPRITQGNLCREKAGSGTEVWHLVHTGGDFCFSYVMQGSPACDKISLQSTALPCFLPFLDLGLMVLPGSQCAVKAGFH